MRRSQHLDLDSHLVLMTMMVQDQLLLHTLARILTIELEPLVFTAITPIQCTLYSKVTDHGKTLTMDLDYEKGSYTADPTKDDSVVCTSVSQVDKEKMKKLMMGAILSGSTSLKITNSNCPLVTLDSSKVEKRTCTISGTTLTDDEGNKYTRK